MEKPGQLKKFEMDYLKKGIGDDAFCFMLIWLKITW
jgi:hypothetical protein